MSTERRRTQKDAKKYAPNPGVEFRTLLSEIRRGTIPPVFFLHGDEDYFIRRSVAAIVDRALDASIRDFNLDVVDGGESDTSTILALANAYPLMSERRVVIVNDIDKLPEWDRLPGYLERPMPSTVLILETVKPDFRRKIFKDLKGASSVRTAVFRGFFDNEVPKWIMEQAKQRGLSFTEEAVVRFHELVGDSPQELESELEKVSVYLGTTGPVSEETVDEVIGFSRTYSPFQLQKAIGTRDRRRAFVIIERMLNAGEPPVRIISILGKFYLDLLKVLDLRSRHLLESVTPRDENLSPGSVREYPAYLRFLDPPRIRRSIRSLCETDLALKSSRADPKLLMTVLIYDLLR